MRGRGASSSTERGATNFGTVLKSCIKAGRFHEARSLCEKSNNVFASAFHAAIANTHLSRIDNEDLVQIAKEDAQERLRKRLGLFATLSFISPLVGLLGTVTGIMQAFNDLGRSGSVEPTLWRRVLLRR